MSHSEDLGGNATPLHVTGSAAPTPPVSLSGLQHAITFIIGADFGARNFRRHMTPLGRRDANVAPRRSGALRPRPDGVRHREIPSNEMGFYLVGGVQSVCCQERSDAWVWKRSGDEKDKFWRHHLGRCYSGRRLGRRSTTNHYPAGNCVTSRVDLSSGSWLGATSLPCRLAPMAVHGPWYRRRRHRPLGSIAKLPHPC